MKFADRTKVEPLSNESQSVVYVPLGLLGFEGSKEFKLLADPLEAPFAWLQTPHEPTLSFLIVDPFLLFPEYQPDLSEDDVEFLKLQRPEEAAVFNIVTLRKGGTATINLKGPIVINRQTRIAKQVIPINAGAYQVQQPLPLAT